MTATLLISGPTTAALVCPAQAVTIPAPSRPLRHTLLDRVGKTVPFGDGIRVEFAPLIAYHNLDLLSGTNRPHHSMSHISMPGHVVKGLPHRPDDRLGDQAVEQMLADSDAHHQLMLSLAPLSMQVTVYPFFRRCVCVMIAIASIRSNLEQHVSML
jgi:hypothetical protein